VQFKDIIGQTAVKTLLTRTASSGRIAHAQLFLGSEGSGNLAIAMAYAQFILCENKAADDSCGVCRSCTKVQKLIHPDLHFAYPTVGAKALSTELLPIWRKAFLENPYLNANEWLRHLDGDNKQGNITAAECLEIVKKLNLKAFESDYKILILWLPEYLGKEGNRLLKLIEEPPEKTVFILVANDQERLLNTILSRCQMVKINPLSDDELINALQTRHDIAAEQAAQIANLADGNYTEALHLLKHSTSDQIDGFLKWFRVAYKGDPTEIVPWAEEFAKTGREPMKHFLRYVLFFLREYTVFIALQTPSIRFNAKENATAASMAKVIQLEMLQPIATLLDESLFAIERNANAKILLTAKTIQLHKILRLL
jgi:DNA polymerase III subunit delta'